VSTIAKKQRTENLPCTLTKVERLAIADRLHDASETLEQTAAAKKKAATDHKSAQANYDMLSHTVATGIEYRDVEVEECLNFDAETYTEVRTDTGEVILERPMSLAERQMTLPEGK